MDDTGGIHHRGSMNANGRLPIKLFGESTMLPLRKCLPLGVNRFEISLEAAIIEMMDATY
jgi:hypothetical protein